MSSLGCMCHLAAFCAVAALKKLPVSVDDLLVDIFIILSIQQNVGPSMIKFDQNLVRFAL